MHTNLTPNQVAYFWSHVEKTADCWIWTGGRHGSMGYGRVKFNGHTYQAHRLAWEVTTGTIADGLDCLHSCDNPVCCRPSHLFLGTDVDNAQDRHGKGRDACGESHGRATKPHRTARGERNGMRMHPGLLRGERNGRAKLDAAKADAIRAAYRAGGTTHRQLADTFGVAKSMVYYIVHDLNWR